MVLTRRMAKLQAASHGDSNPNDNNAASVRATKGNSPAQVHSAVCKDMARKAAVLSAPTHGNGNEGNGTFTTKIHTEDEPILAGPRSVVSYNTESPAGTSTYKVHHEASGKVQPLAGPSGTQANGHFLKISRMQTQNTCHGEHHSSPLSSAPPSPTAPRQSEAAKKLRRRKGTRTRWSRTKGQRTKAKDKANEPTQNPKATGSSETVTDPVQQKIPAQERSIKCLPRRAAKTADINEVVRKAEAAVRKGKRKANPHELPTTKEAQTGCKRARNESIFSVEDNQYHRVDPGPSRTTRRVRQRTVAPLVSESPVLVELTSAGRLRSVPVQPLTAKTKKRKANALEHTDESRTAKRRKMEDASSPRPSASDFVAMDFERPTDFEPSALSLSQIKREQSLEPSPSSSSSSPARRPLYDVFPNSSYLEVGGEDDEMRDVEDALDLVDTDYSRSQINLRQELAHLHRRLAEEELVPPRTTSGPAEDVTNAIDTDDRSSSPPDTRILSSTRHRQELLVDVGERLPLAPQFQTNLTAIPTPYVVPAAPPVQYQPQAPFRRGPIVNLRRLVRTLTPGPCPEWLVTTAESSREMSTDSSSESSFPSTPVSSPPRFTLMSSPRSGSRSLTRSPSPLQERERSMAPEPSDGLIEALRAGRVSICPSPSPTECDTEE